MSCLTEGAELLFKQKQGRLYHGNCFLCVTEHYSAWVAESTVEAKNVIRESEVTLFPGGAIEIDEE